MMLFHLPNSLKKNLLIKGLAATLRGSRPGVQFVILLVGYSIVTLEKQQQRRQAQM